MASASLVGAIAASHRHRKIAASAGMGVFVALTSWQWKLWADRFTRETSRTSV